MKNDAKQPQVSVITVCYNDADDLEKTIKSVVYQTIENKEFIIVDGGSKDSTSEVIRKYSKWINHWISEPDKGVYDAMNKGVALASGEWICFMNAGDTFKEKTTLQHVFDYKDYSRNTGVIYGDVEFLFPRCGSVMKRMDGLEGKDRALGINHQASLTRLELLKEIGFDLSYKIASDANTFYKIWQMGADFEYVPICMANYEAVTGLSSSKFIPSFEERARILGLKWNNSINWWIGYVKAAGKMLQRKMFSSEAYEAKYYNRIANKYGANKQ